MTFEVISTEHPLPPETSGKGTNTLYIACNAVGFSSNYAVCQHVLAKHREGALPQSYSGCGQAIDAGNCDAAKMQKMEKEAGKALFYRERQRYVEKVVEEKVRPVDTTSESYQRGRYGLKAVQAKSQPVKAPAQQGPVEFNPAAVINAGVQGEKEKAARQKGETPAEFLRRLRGM